jgi:hypothetical protein
MPVRSTASRANCRSAGLDGGMGRQDENAVYESRLLGGGGSGEDNID